MDRPANAARGEAAILVGGDTVVLRPSFSALVAAEEELGSLFALVERAAAGELRLAEMAGLFWHCSDGRASREALGEAVAEGGLARATPAAENFADADVAGAQMTIFVIASEAKQSRVTRAGLPRHLRRLAMTGWRAALSASFDSGASWQAAGATAAPAVLGVATAALAPAGSALLDRANAVEVVLAGDSWLEGRDDDALVAGANLAVLGGELIQFGAAEPLGDGHFRLSRLLRGRRGTEWAAGLHEAGEGFALLDAQALISIEAPALGGEARVLADGVGDDPAGVEERIAISGEALRPPNPVQLRAMTTAAGDIAISWTRRSRQGWNWSDGGDAPLGEEREAYRIEIAGAGFARITESDEPSCLYTAAQQAADGAVAPLQVTVAQAGTFAASRPAILIID